MFLLFLQDTVLPTFPFEKKVVYNRGTLLWAKMAQTPSVYKLEGVFPDVSYSKMVSIMPRKLQQEQKLLIIHDVSTCCRYMAQYHERNTLLLEREKELANLHLVERELASMRGAFDKRTCFHEAEYYSFLSTTAHLSTEIKQLRARVSTHEQQLASLNEHIEQFLNGLTVGMQIQSA